MLTEDRSNGIRRGGGVIWLKSVKCTGDESYLTDCEHEIHRENDCVHHDDIMMRYEYTS